MAVDTKIRAALNLKKLKLPPNREKVSGVEFGRRVTEFDARLFFASENPATTDDGRASII